MGRRGGSKPSCPWWTVKAKNRAQRQCLPERTGGRWRGQEAGGRVPFIAAHRVKAIWASEASWRCDRAGLGGVHALASAPRGRAERRTHMSCRPNRRRPEVAGSEVM
jgi:hypothetical protein